MFNVSVVVPFRDQENSNRGKVWEWNRLRWRSSFRGFELIVSDSDTEEFSRSEARNLGVEKASGDVIVLADADSAVNVSTLCKSIDAVMNEDIFWSIAHSEYLMMSEAATEEVLKLPSSCTLNVPHMSLIRTPFRSDAGMIVVKKEAFQEAGGYDTRFTGWGLEDWAFRDVMITFFGKPHRASGYLYHFYHGVPEGEDFNSPPSKENQEIYQEYKNALGDTDAMRKVLEER